MTTLYAELRTLTDNPNVIAAINTATITRAELLSLDLSGKNIVIIGSPASGKTTLARLIADRIGMFEPWKIIHTDNYMQPERKDDYKIALYDMIADLKKIHVPLIIEGVQGYRLLRKGVEGFEGWNFYPDVVIELVVTDAQVRRVYERDRKGKDAGSLVGFNKMHSTILEKYRAMDNPAPPVWYTVKNEF